MAPQILLRSTYTKSVDIWSCSIIMFMLFNQGKHPIYRQKMTGQQYKKQLVNYKRKPLQNELAQNFFQRISRNQPLQRYNATQALKHPWLTRKNDPIPLSIHESFKGFQNSQKIHQMILVSVILDYKLNKKISKQYDNNYLKKCQEYNKKSQIEKQKDKEKKKLNRQMVSAEHIKQLFGEYENKNLNGLKNVPLQKKYTNIPNIQKLNDIFTNIFQKKSGIDIQKTQLAINTNSKQFQNQQSKLIQPLDQNHKNNIINDLIKQSVKQLKSKQYQKNRRIFSKKTLKNNQKTKVSTTLQKKSSIQNINSKSQVGDPTLYTNENSIKSNERFGLKKRNKTTIKIKQIRYPKQKKIVVTQQELCKK